MSFLGKILIVAQVVLSVLFMCAAVAVFGLHTNWRDSAKAKDTQIQKLTSDRQAESEKLNQEITQLNQRVAAEENRANAIVGERNQLAQSVENLTQQTNSLNQQLQRQTGLAIAKTNEAQFRQAEAEQQRVQNETLSASLDAQIRAKVALEDQLATLQQTHNELVALQESTQQELAIVQRVVRANKLATDAQTVASLSDPPPPVEGVVRDIRKDQANRTKWVHITVGSDDGIRVNHEMDVFRTAERNNGRARWLGRIRIYSVTPDEAVGQVVEAAKNGIIEVGDNVTTKLN